MNTDHGGRIIAETTEQGILLRPSVAFPIELYTDACVNEFDVVEADLAKHLKRQKK